MNLFRNLFRRGSCDGERWVQLEQMHRDLMRLHKDVLYLHLNYQRRTMTALSDLQATVHHSDDVVESALALINGFADRLAAAGTDPAALQALQSDLSTHAQALADAVAANTLAAPAPAPAESTTDPVDPADPAAT